MIVVVTGGGRRRSPDMFSFGFQRTIGPGASHVACKGQPQVRMMFTALKQEGVSLLVPLLGGWAVDEEEDHIAL